MKKCEMKISTAMIVQLSYCGYFFFIWIFLSLASKIMFFFLEGHSKYPGHKFLISKIHCAKILGLSDQSGRQQSKNASGEGGDYGPLPYKVGLKR